MLKMSAILVVVSAAALLLWGMSTLGAGELAKHPNLDDAAVESAVQHLRTAKQASDLDAVRAGIARAVKALGEKHFAAQMLTSARPESDAGIARLQKDIGRAIETLTFRPWMEADVPVGFPDFTPVHHIEVKTLPAYRMARTSMDAKNRQNSAFWSLFGHIKRNNIAMTAPVQMDHSSSELKAPVASMAFLYSNSGLGSRGADSSDRNVTVVDIPEQLVVSIGVRGKRTAQSVELAHRKLRDWLKQRNKELTTAGPLRTMSYNSPFIPSNRAFFELHIPLTRHQ